MQRAMVLLLLLGTSALQAQPLDERTLENLVAFTRTTGYVRYFHPAAAVERTRWDAFTAAAIPEVERARTPRELAAVLARLYPRSAVVPPHGFVRRVVQWEHRGVVTSPRAPHDGFRSARLQRWRVERWGRVTFLALAVLALLAAIVARRPVLLLGTLFAWPATRDLEPPPAFTADLGRGLTWSMPLELPVAVADVHPPFVASGTATPRTQRLAGVITVWNVLQHFYPYFDDVPVDWPAALRKALRKAATDPDDRAFRDTLRALGRDLRDSHAWVKQFRGEQHGRLPLRFAWVEEQLAVIDVAPGVEDIVDGIRPGDTVRAIDGIPARDFIARRTTITPGATDAGAWHLAVYLLSHGPAGEALRLTLDGGATRELRFGKAQFAPRYAPIAEVAPGIVRVDLDDVNADSFRAALPRLEAARGIIFDLEIYPEGFPEPLMLQHLVDEPVITGRHEIGIVRQPDRRDLRFVARKPETREPLRPRLRAKIAFTTSPIAVSYAEHVLDAVQFYRLGKVVGATTAGSFGAYTHIELPGRIYFDWTVTRSRRLDGTPLHGRGIPPDIPAQRTLRGIREGRDEVLEAAIAAVR